MSWLDDLADFGGAIVDKAIDYQTAVANEFGISDAQAAEGVAPVIPVQTSPLGSLGGGVGQYLPWIAAGGAGLVLVLVLMKKG